MDSSTARLQQIAPPDESFADCLIAGLSRVPKEIPCKYFYDQEGSELFERICALPEYTRPAPRRRCWRAMPAKSRS